MITMMVRIANTTIISRYGDNWPFIHALNEQCNMVVMIKVTYGQKLKVSQIV